MENQKYITDLIAEYGETLYGAETPAYIAKMWASVLPEVDLSDLREWLDCGFWDPYIIKALLNAGVLPHEVMADTVYDLCNGDLPMSLFLKTRRN